MSLRWAPLVFLIGSVLPPASPGAAPPTGCKVPDFRLEDPRDRRTVSRADLGGKTAVVVFLGCECPLSNQFLPVLSGLSKEYKDRGVVFVGVNSNSQDGLGRVAEHARRHGVPFPVLKDPGNKVADLFGARRTPEAFVLDASGTIRYQGRIDDQFGIGYARAGKPTRRDLAEALDEVLAGKPVSVPAAAAAGCLIGRVTSPRADGPVTFARQVSRILQKNCQDCHRPGRIGPMSLLTYDDALAWADTIREVVAERRMPPWHADPRHGKFANDRSLPKEDREALLAWLDNGTPRGDDRDLPPPRQVPEGWTIGEPDLVIQMPRAYDVPAQTPKGGVPYQYFTVDPGFKEDRWVERAEARGGAPAVVHHIVVFILPRGELFNPEAPGAVLCGTAPGDLPLVLPPGFARKIPAGARLIFQMHYTPNGKAYRDRSSVALLFARQTPRHRALTKPIHDPSFVTRFTKIPAGAANFKIEATHTFRQDVHVMNFMPHMHLRGKDFLYEAVYPDGKREVLLSVPQYNFNWQSVYRLAEPVALPKGTKLRCVAHFDNSPKNPHNPDPAQDVFWGDQTWEEMMIGWIDYYRDDENK